MPFGPFARPTVTTAQRTRRHSDTPSPLSAYQICSAAARTSALPAYASLLRAYGNAKRPRASSPISVSPTQPGLPARTFGISRTPASPPGTSSATSPNPSSTVDASKRANNKPAPFARRPLPTTRPSYLEHSAKWKTPLMPSHSSPAKKPPFAKPLKSSRPAAKKPTSNCTGREWGAHRPYICDCMAHPTA